MNAPIWPQPLSDSKGETLTLRKEAARKALRKGQPGQIWFALRASSLGQVLVARDTEGLCAVLLGDYSLLLKRTLQNCFPAATLINDEKEVPSAQVVAFLESPTHALTLPLTFQGTAFQKEVWQALRLIPLGTTVSYKDVACQLGMPKATRAVASACAANRLAVVIPCHRVVRSDGFLSGYRWGLERKRILLKREAELRQPTSKSFIG